MKAADTRKKMASPGVRRTPGEAMEVTATRVPRKDCDMQIARYFAVGVERNPERSLSPGNPMKC
jgi:hypothetical protein